MIVWQGLELILELMGCVARGSNGAGVIDLPRPVDVCSLDPGQARRENVQWRVPLD